MLIEHKKLLDNYYSPPNFIIILVDKSSRTCYNQHGLTWVFNYPYASYTEHIITGLAFLLNIALKIKHNRLYCVCLVF